MRQRPEDVLAGGNGRQREYATDGPRFQQANVVEDLIIRGGLMPETDRGGDQTAIRVRYSYEPVYNQLHTVIDPRGLDPSYVPPTGGVTSEARYTTRHTFDFQEGTDLVGLADVLGVTVPEVTMLLADAGIAIGLGDVNGDGRTDQIAGNVIRTDYPSVTLLASSNQAALEGDTVQEVVELFAFNDFGQLIRHTDPEANVTEYAYYPERDPNGDGIIDNPLGDPTTGGYLQQITVDTTSNPLRNSGTNPTSTNIHRVYEYDTVGNVTREINGRGIATDCVVNALNQVVQIVHAAGHDLISPLPVEPTTPVDFRYLERLFYDANDNVVRRQVEDRGNTSDVGFPGDINSDGKLDASDIDELYASFGLPPTPITDFNADGMVGMADMNILILDLFGTRYGDANLDGVVDTSDFNVWNTNKFTAGGGWAKGNFTGDAVVDASDFNVWNSNKFTIGQGNRSIPAVDFVYEYDILDQLVESREEVDKDHQLVTRFRYDPNQNSVLTLFPEGNAQAAIYDERDLLYQTIEGRLITPPLVLLAPGDPTDFDVRGGIECTCTTYHYDLNGNLIETVDAADTDLSTDNNSDLGGSGDRTRYIYDGFDRLASVIDSVGNQTVYQYDPAGNRVRELTFGPVGGASPTADGPDIWPAPFRSMASSRWGTWSILICLQRPSISMTN